jgi:hypothetical protein
MTKSITVPGYVSCQFAGVHQVLGHNLQLCRKRVLAGKREISSLLEVFRRFCYYEELEVCQLETWNRVYQLRHRLKGVVSEVHLMNRAAVSPSL